MVLEDMYNLCQKKKKLCTSLGDDARKAGARGVGYSTLGYGTVMDGTGRVVDVSSRCIVLVGKYDSVWNIEGWEMYALKEGTRCCCQYEQ